MMPLAHRAERGHQVQLDALERRGVLAELRQTLARGLGPAAQIARASALPDS
jgi:hypothetical protein